MRGSGACLSDADCADSSEEQVDKNDEGTDPGIHCVMVSNESGVPACRA